MYKTCKKCGYVFEKGLVCKKCNNADVESKKWINTIKLKNLFVDDPEDKDTLSCCVTIIPQLEMILKNNSDILGSDQYSMMDEIIDAFKSIKQDIETGKELYDDEYCTWAELFNRYLDELYNIGDTIMSGSTFFEQQHFLWVD